MLIGRSPARTLLRAGVLAITLLGVSQFVLSPVRAVGISMMPTYVEGQFMLLNRLAFRYSTPRRGDIVAIGLAGGLAVLVKRVVGLPGERIRFVDGVLLVNDRPLDEPYVFLRIPWNVPEVTLAADEYYVVGDNRSMAAHNHDFGVARLEKMVGRVLR
jgi:signal peptidase I